MRYPGKAVEKSLTLVFISSPLKLAIVYFWFNGFGGRPKALAGVGTMTLKPHSRLAPQRRCRFPLSFKSGGEPRALVLFGGSVGRTTPNAVV